MTTRVAIGALIALPLLLVFGRLFAAADSNFDMLMHNLFNWDIKRLLGHLFVAGFFTWLTAGFLHMEFLAQPLPPVLLDALPQLPEQQRCETAAKILSRWSPPKSSDWRTWNFSRAQAWGLVGEKMAYLKQVACSSP